MLTNKYNASHQIPNARCAPLFSRAFIAEADETFVGKQYVVLHLSSVLSVLRLSVSLRARELVHDSSLFPVPRLIGIFWQR